jgi:phosphatidylserine/phosphatidylglycerophosphate/cardiolipin synthase-like enzyme
VRVAIARTEPLMPDAPEVREIETLYLDMIATAKRMIYAESQYFASRRIAEAVIARDLRTRRARSSCWSTR